MGSVADENCFSVDVGFEGGAVAETPCFDGGCFSEGFVSWVV